MNLRPSGYEPDELPGCSIPRQPCSVSSPQMGKRFGLMPDIVNGFFIRTISGSVPASASEPGGVLLFRRLSGSTIGAAWFHGRVRDGIGWVTGAMATKLRSWCWKIDAVLVASHVPLRTWKPAKSAERNPSEQPAFAVATLMLMMGLSSMNRAIRTG